MGVNNIFWNCPALGRTKNGLIRFYPIPLVFGQFLQRNGDAFNQLILQGF